MNNYLPNAGVFLLTILATIVIASGKPADDSAWIVQRAIRATRDRVTPQEDLEPHSPRIYSMNIKSDIQLRYAITEITSRVANPSNQSQEITFRVVLPDNAFISGFVMDIDEKSYAATVKEKIAAAQEFDAAVSQGQSAAHVSYARDANEFTVSLNIEALAKVAFHLTYDELLVRRLGVYEHAIHVSPGQVVPIMTVDVSISEVLPIISIKVPILRDDLQKIDVEPDNDLARIERKNNNREATIRFHPSEEQQKQISRNGLQGQFVVQYDVDRSSVEDRGGEVHVVDGYFVHFFAPSSLPSLPKHAVFVLDTSGSMEGTKMQQTKQAMESILDQLRPGDLFSVIEFASTVQEWDLRKAYQPLDSIFDGPSGPLAHTGNVETSFGRYDHLKAYPATKSAIERGKVFIRSMRAEGGTNINEAMLRALNNAKSIGRVTELTPMIILLTDGEPSEGVKSTESILANVKAANSGGQVSVYCLSFGFDADFPFLKRMSAQNQAFARKIYEASDATLQLKGFFTEIASPQLTGVKFVYDGAVSDVTETDLGIYYRGSEIVVAGKAAGGSVRATVNGVEAGGYAYTKFLQKDQAPKTNERSLEKIWAYLTIKDLLHKSDIADRNSYQRQALAIALQYQFVTPLTSLLVVKPNQDSSVADLKPAVGPQNDVRGGSSSAGSRPLFPGSIGNPFPSPGFGAPETEFFGGFGNVPSPPPPVASTTTRPRNPTTEKRFSIKSYIESLNHNETFVTLGVKGETMTLQWQNYMQEDQDYQACNLTSKGKEGHCRSIWSCPELDDRQLIDSDDFCVINDSHLGICCVSPSVSNH